jgi:hypothetical protein
VTFETWKADPLLRRLVLFSVANLTDDAPVPLDTLTNKYKMLWSAQAEIRPDSLLFGYFTPSWTLLQDQYLWAIGEPISRPPRPWSNATAHGCYAMSIYMARHPSNLTRTSIYIY